MKECSKCKILKELTEFHKERAKPDGFGNYCKECNYISHCLRYNKIPIRITERNLPIDKPFKAKTKKSQEEKRQYSRDYMRKRLKNIDNRLLHNMRSRFYRAFKKEYVKGKTIENLGCNISEFKKYLSEKFVQGMTWDNYGKWEIDHIIPLSSAKTIEEAWKLNHYTNLQPLWKKENRHKWNKLNLTT